MGASFEDLEVWKKACRLSIRLYNIQDASIIAPFIEKTVNRQPQTNTIFIFDSTTPRGINHVQNVPPCMRQTQPPGQKASRCIAL
jgi:hypothetical protein